MMKTHIDEYRSNFQVIYGLAFIVTLIGSTICTTRSIAQGILAMMNAFEGDFVIGAAILAIGIVITYLTGITFMNITCILAIPLLSRDQLIALHVSTKHSQAMRFFHAVARKILQKDTRR